MVTPTCRICMAEDDGSQPMIQPCICKGSVAFVHRSCLSAWMQQSGRQSCELCHASYRYSKRLKSLSRRTMSPVTAKLFSRAFVALTLFITQQVCIYWSIPMMSNNLSKIKDLKQQWDDDHLEISVLTLHWTEQSNTLRNQLAGCQIGGSDQTVNWVLSTNQSEFLHLFADSLCNQTYANETLWSLWSRVATVESYLQVKQADKETKASAYHVLTTYVILIGVFIFGLGSIAVLISGPLALYSFIAAVQMYGGENTEFIPLNYVITSENMC